jgi:hypothetical protein
MSEVQTSLPSGRLMLILAKLVIILVGIVAGQAIL